MDMFPWIEILKYAGPALGIIIFFIYRDWQREIKLTSRIETLEQYQRDILEQLVEKSTVALTQSTECLKAISTILFRLMQICPRVLDNLPNICE